MLRVLSSTRRCGASVPRLLSSVADDDPGLHKSPITDALWKQRRAEKEIYEGSGNYEELPPQVELQVKSPADSEVRIDYDFATDSALRDRYTNCWGAVDKGVLLEDCDAIAGNVSWRHAVLGNGRTVRPPVLVTAAVDEVRMRGSLRPDTSAFMRGRVVFVGSSSMLVRCEVGPAAKGGPAGGNKEEPLMVADFLYVARDRVTGRASKVNRLEVSEAADVALFDEKLAEVEAKRAARGMGAEAKLALDDATKRKASARVGEAQALIRMPALQAHRGVLVGATELQNTMICQPQQRNTSGRVFGGFLMRRAYELALSTAHCVSGHTPRFLWSDEISFQAPVSIGDVLRFDSRVIATEPGLLRPRIHTEVFASVLKPGEASSQLSNRFAFSFCLDPSDDQKAKNGGAAGASSPRVPEVFSERTGDAIKQNQVLEASRNVPDWDM